MSFILKFTDPTADECDFGANSLVVRAAQLRAGAQPVANTGTTSATGTVTSAAPVAIDYFPADPTQAPIPSPEQSKMLLTAGGVIAGPKYLWDSRQIYFGLTLAGLAADGSAGAHVSTNGAVRTELVSEIVVCQGEVWCIAFPGGQQQYFNPATASFYNGSMPTPGPAGTQWGAAAIAATAAAALTTALTPPVRSAIAPGSSGKVLTTGVGMTYATISAAILAAADGDTVSLAAGTYVEALPKIPAAILLTGPTVALANGTITPTVTLDFSSFQSAQLAGGGLGGVSFKNDGVVANIAITGAGIHDTAAQLCSGIRTEGGYLTVKSCHLFGNQVGVGQGGANCVVEIDGALIEQNGIDGQSHDVYVGGGGQGTLIVANSLIVNPLTAHAVKTRFPALVVSNSTLESPNGSCIDIPNGLGVTGTLTDCTFIKAAGSPDHQIITMGEEGATNGGAGLSIAGGTIEALCDNPLISVVGGTITLTGVMKTGNPITAPSGGVVGL